MSKISGILSDEESVRQLSELAKMFKDGAGDNKLPENDVQETSSSDSMPDIEQIMKIMSLANTFSQQDSNTALLLALRPHLQEAKQQKLDRALKLLKIIAVYNAAKESGLINNLL